jgi:hypothetical protein
MQISHTSVELAVINLKNIKILNLKYTLQFSVTCNSVNSMIPKKCNWRQRCSVDV